MLILTVLVSFFLQPQPPSKPPIIISSRVQTVPPLPDILEKIALCESKNIATAKNSHSTASGRFQFLKSSWEFYGKQLWGDDWIKKDVFNWDDNTELARYVFAKNSTKDWESSKSCWES